MAWPATSMVPDVVSTRTRPRNTTEYSSNSGVWPGSVQPAGLSMRAMLTAAVAELTPPTYSAIRFGRLPDAAMMLAFRSGRAWIFLTSHNARQPARRAFHIAIPPRTAPEAPPPRRSNGADNRPQGNGSPKIGRAHV